VNSEITDVTNLIGWILFDADCRLCVGLARRWGPFLHRHRFALVPLQTPWVRERLAISDNALLTEMRLLTPLGETFGGADALIEVAKRIWWAWPFHFLGHVPGVRTVLRKAYAWVARHRHCRGGACKLQFIRQRPRSKRVFFEMP